MLEIFFSNEEKPSTILKKCSKNVQYFNNLNLSIIPTLRSSIHENIERRLDNMINCGLLEEVSKLLITYKSSEMPAMSTIGYRQVNEYLSGNITFSDMRNDILASTRQLAKRQITWLRHLDATTVYSFSDYDNIEERINSFLEKKNNNNK